MSEDWDWDWDWVKKEGGSLLHLRFFPVSWMCHRPLLDSAFSGFPWAEPFLLLSPSG